MREGCTKGFDVYVISANRFHSGIRSYSLLIGGFVVMCMSLNVADNLPHADYTVLWGNALSASIGGHLGLNRNRPLLKNNLMRLIQVCHYYSICI